MKVNENSFEESGKELNSKKVLAEQYNSLRIKAPLSRIVNLAGMCANMKGIKQENRWIIEEMTLAAQELNEAIVKVNTYLKKVQ